MFESWKALKCRGQRCALGKRLLTLEDNAAERELARLVEEVEDEARAKTASKEAHIPHSPFVPYVKKFYMPYARTFAASASGSADFL